MVEPALGGVTCFADMYFFAGRVAEAAERVGLRAIVGQAVMGEAAPDADVPEAALDRFRALDDRWNGHRLIAPALAPHAPDTLDTAGCSAAIKPAANGRRERILAAPPTVLVALPLGRGLGEGAHRHEPPHGSHVSEPIGR